MLTKFPFVDDCYLSPCQKMILSLASWIYKEVLVGVCKMIPHMVNLPFQGPIPSLL